METQKLPGDEAFDSYWEEFQDYWARKGGSREMAYHAFAAGWNARRIHGKEES